MKSHFYWFRLKNETHDRFDGFHFTFVCPVGGREKFVILVSLVRFCGGEASEATRGGGGAWVKNYNK